VCTCLACWLQDISPRKAGQQTSAAAAAAAAARLGGMRALGMADQSGEAMRRFAKALVQGAHTRLTA
jgi:hypothetical protein